MYLKNYKPTTPSRRFRIIIYNKNFRISNNIHFLNNFIKNSAGRDNLGHISVRHRGSGNKIIYRKIDFSRNLYNIKGKVIRLEYDPYRSAHIALICYQSGILSYIIAPNNLNVGDIIYTANSFSYATGTTTFLKNIILGTAVHNIEFFPGHGGQIARSAGTYAIVVDEYDNNFNIVRLPSGELRKFNKYCLATIGIVSNIIHKQRIIGKAGISRHLNKRPHVRGIAMNPVDHPHGGRTNGGQPSVSA